MVYVDYAIRDVPIADARAAIERALAICFEKRESSWYAFPYFRCAIDKQHNLRLAVNQDFEGEPLEDDIALSAAVLEATGITEEDPLIVELDKLGFLCRIRSTTL